MKKRSKPQQPQTYNLRKRQKKTVFQQYNLAEDQLNSAVLDSDELKHKKKRNKKRKMDNQQDYQFNVDESSEDDQSGIFDENQVIDRLPENQQHLVDLLGHVKQRLKYFKQIFVKQQQELVLKKSHVGENSVPICADITKFNFDNLIKKQFQITQGYFDVIMMDPPWKLSSSQPSRGVAIQYDSLGDQYIENIPVPKIQKNGGLLIIWAINAKYAFTISLMQKWGYKVVDSITWVKKTINGKIAKGHGFYLQHAKQTCLVGVKGQLSKFVKGGVAKDVIFSQRRGQSQKPTQIYDYIQKLVPNGYYLQIFGRRNNLKNKWVTIGNQI